MPLSHCDDMAIDVHINIRITLSQLAISHKYYQGTIRLVSRQYFLVTALHDESILYTFAHINTNYLTFISVYNLHLQDEAITQ